MNNEIKDDSLKPLITLQIVVILIWLFSIFILFLFIKDWNIRSQFGDMFGAISSLFSGLAFAGMIYTIYLQKKELSLQRQELRDTRKELSRSALAQEKSEMALNKQVLLQNMTAKLTSLNILMNYNTEKAERVKRGQPSLYHTLLNDNEKYSVEIETLLGIINKLSSN